MDKQKRHKPGGKPTRIMIVAGEASGDLHGGGLAYALFSKNRDIDLVGFGGKTMRAAGVDVRFDIKKLGIVGIVEVLFHFRVLLEAYRTAVSLLQEEVDLLVLIDFSGFNLRVAKAAKRFGIPVVYYVSPQVWAWRAGRVKTIAERVDQMIVILPFEKEIYDKAQVPCEFVGHPLLDEFERVKQLNAAAPGQARAARFPIIALLPGSRTREVMSLLPVMLAGVECLFDEYPDLQVLVPVASSLPEDLIPGMTRASRFPIQLVYGTVYDVFENADIAVVASGTATLQGALAAVPMVVVYKVSWISYILAKSLVRVKSISLANIVADEPFIPELIQKEVSPLRIAEELRRLLRDAHTREKMRQELRVVSGRLGTPGASDRAASIIFRVLHKTQARGQEESLKAALRVPA